MPFIYVSSRFGDAFLSAWAFSGIDTDLSSFSFFFLRPKRSPNTNPPTQKMGTPKTASLTYPEKRQIKKRKEKTLFFTPNFVSSAYIAAKKGRIKARKRYFFPPKKVGKSEWER